VAISFKSGDHIGRHRRNRSTLWAALIASLPLTSLLAFIWLYIETGDYERIAALSQSIFWLVLPSLALFLSLPFFLRLGWSFWISLGISCFTTAAFYSMMVWVLDFYLAPMCSSDGF